MEEINELLKNSKLSNFEKINYGLPVSINEFESVEQEKKKMLKISLKAEYLTILNMILQKIKLMNNLCLKKNMDSLVVKRRIK